MSIFQKNSERKEAATGKEKKAVHKEWWQTPNAEDGPKQGYSSFSPKSPSSD